MTFDSANFLKIDHFRISYQKKNPVFIILNMSFSIGVIGGGVAGSTIAMKLAENGIKCVLFQSSSSLINGPPMCHLHAGGALYREIPTEHCVRMLKQSIDTLKYYKYSANVRPTLLTVPLRDPGSPSDIINRLEFLAQRYSEHIEEDKSNAVLGKPEDYFKVFTEEQVYKLREKSYPTEPKTMEEWLIPPAKNLDLEKFKFPFIMVNQYGLSSLRTSAFANLALERSNNCQVLKNTTVTDIRQTDQKKWIVTYKVSGNQELNEKQFDFLVNACGYRSGLIDDMAGFKVERMLEFKAAYIAEWKECEGHWPEVIMHGKRKTPEGMAQLTPYQGNIFQIHGMTEDITLFKDGLVKTNDQSSQPKFNSKINSILKDGWDQKEVYDRTRKAIDHVSNFIPSFTVAKQTRKPLYGAQQIPGQNPDLRAASISYEGTNYARSEIVKASTAIKVAEDLIKKLKSVFGKNKIQTRSAQTFAIVKRDEVVQKAKMLAMERNYPTGLAEFYY